MPEKVSTTVYKDLYTQADRPYIDTEPLLLLIIFVAKDY